jgi:outer membrane protein TolC
MKRFPNRWRALPAAAAIGLLAFSAAASGQERPVVSARSGQQHVRELPAPTQGGIPLSLEQAIGLTLANNQDLNVTVNAAESTRYTLFQAQGIYDPLLTASISRSHTEQPFRAAVNTTDSTDGRSQVSQLAPTGGIFALGFTANKTTNNSSFNIVNPSYASGIQLSMVQPLLRNFGPKTTTWLIRIARNTRDSSYQDFVRSVQTVVNSVEQAYWDLSYAIQNLEVKKESLRIAQDLNRITRIKIDVGSLAPIEITQTEVGIATAEQDIITADGLIGVAQDRLTRLLNVDPVRWSTTPIIPTDEVRGGDVKIQVEEGTKTALARRPEILSLAYFVDSDQIRYDYYKNQVLPGLNLTASYGNPGIGGDTHDPNTGALLSTGNFGDAFQQVIDRKFKNWSVGLNFSYPILNRAAKGLARRNTSGSPTRPG